MINNLVNKKAFFPTLLLLLSFIPLWDFFQPGLPITHDGQDHVARIANFYQNLQEGVIIPRWAPNLNWGYGHPVLIFLYPFPSYLASFFHFLNFSFVDSTKLVFIIGFVFSGLTMYFWLKEFLPKQAAFIGGMLYIFAPYRFVDLYVRGAIGEHTAFIFPPLILYFLLKLSKKYSYKYLALGSLSLAGLILSHNAISLMFLPILILYSLYLLFQAKQKKYLVFMITLLIIFGFSLSSFFWIPALIEGKYTLREIVTNGGYLNNFTEITKLLYSPWAYGVSGEFSVQIGILHWVGILTAILMAFNLFKKKNKIVYLILGIVIIFIISLFLMERSSQFIWERVNIIQKFQFPWRFLSVSLFAASAAGAAVISLFPKKRLTIIVLLLTFLILYFNKDYWHAKGYQDMPERFYSGIYNGTTDTGESAPIWSVRFMEKIPKSRFEVIQGKAKVAEVERSINRHIYRIDASTLAGIRDNTIYFPGWVVLVDNKPVEIQYQDPNNRGVITFLVEKGVHSVGIKFTETKLRFIADAISIVSLILLVLGYFVFPKVVKFVKK